MYLLKTELKNVNLIKFNQFSDFRGKVIETYIQKNFSNLKIKFVQDTVSISNKNVLRGLHGDYKTWKLISVIFGTSYIIIANNDKKSSQFKKWKSFELSDKNNYQILIPPKFALGYVALSSKLILNYKQTTYYGNYKQFTIKYNDPDFNFNWPNKKFILSKRDK